MVAPVPYVHFAGVAAEALHRYRSVFGGDVVIHSFADFGRDDGPADAVAHGELHGPVSLFAADAVGDDRPVRTEGVLLSLLGYAAPDELTAWFRALADGGEVIDALQERPWGDTDGVVRDRFGLTWLIGFTASAAASPSLALGDGPPPA